MRVEAFGVQETPYAEENIVRTESLCVWMMQPENGGGSSDRHRRSFSAGGGPLWRR